MSIVQYGRAAGKAGLLAGASQRNLPSGAFRVVQLTQIGLHVFILVHFEHSQRFFSKLPMSKNSLEVSCSFRANASGTYGTDLSADGVDRRCHDGCRPGGGLKLLTLYRQLPSLRKPINEGDSDPQKVTDVTRRRLANAAGFSH